MSWILLGILSALLLGLYDIAKKRAVAGNAVLPVLFLSTVAGALALLPFVLAGRWPVTLSAPGHGLIALKSALVAASWIAAYFALKHLPISVAAPLRASQPLFTVLGAVLLFGEAPTGWQWAGLAVILVSYYAFAWAGRLEGISFRRNGWVWLMVLAAVLGALSAFYDKFLLQRLALPPTAVQWWFAVYLVPLTGLVALIFWLPGRARTTPFAWRWSIPLIGLLLVAADFAYFQAMARPEALLAVLSAVRRTNVVISFCVGGLIFRDANLRRKALPLAGIVAGALILMLAR